MSKQIEDIVYNYDLCRSFQKNNTKEPMIPKEIPKEPWEIVASDIFYLLGKQFVLVVDTYSKYVEINELHDLTTESTIKSIKEIFARYGVPKILYTDSGSQYTSAKFKKFANEWGFKHQITTPKYHQSNGLAERHIQTIKRILKKIIQEGKEKEMTLLQLRNMPIDEKGTTPAELMYSRKVRNLIPNFTKKKIQFNKYSKILRKRQEQQKIYYDRGSKELKQFNIGDNVKIHNENKTKPHNDGIITNIDSNPRSYEIKTENGNIIKRNRKDLTKGIAFNENRDYIDDMNPLSSESLAEPIVNQNVDNNNLECNNNGSNNELNNDICKSPPIVTRSGRVSHRPKYLQEYDCTVKRK